MQLNRPFATVTPTLDGDVLAVLAAADVTFTVPQIQKILTSASDEGIRKVLKRLTAQGVVIQERVGPTSTYRLNADHLAAEPIRALSRLASTFLERLDEHLKKWGKSLRYAAVFGSAATGRMTLDSDIDLFMVRACVGAEDADAWQQRVADLARAITAWTGNDGNIVEYTEDDLRAAAAAGEPLLRDVAARGLTVAGKPAWLTRQLHASSNNAAARGH